jgi:hypothetical protein
MSIPYAVQHRRDTLYHWMCERPEHNGLTASEIVDVSGNYAGDHRPYGHCFEDLRWLNRYGNMVRSVGRPARWTVRKYAA